MFNKSGAFTCSKCPKHNDYENGGCPMWWEIIQTNDEGKTRVERGCGYQMMPQLLIEVIKSADHTTAAAYSMRNQVIGAVDKFLINTNNNEILIEDNSVKGIEN